MTPIEYKLKNIVSILTYLRKSYGVGEEGVKRISMPCMLPGHKETKGKSFVYEIDRGYWRCYGKCKRGGNIVDLHMASTGITSREEAINSLCVLFAISKDVSHIKLDSMLTIDEEDMKKRDSFRKNTKNVNTIEEYLLLDYIMSFSVPQEDREDLKRSVLLRYQEEGFFSTKELI